MLAPAGQRSFERRCGALRAVVLLVAWRVRAALAFDQGLHCTGVEACDAAELDQLDASLAHPPAHGSWRNAKDHGYLGDRQERRPDGLICCSASKRVHA